MRFSKYLFLLLFFYADNLFAGDYSDWAVPTQVELVSSGLLIYGSFGDPNNCGRANMIFVHESDSRFDSILSMALAAQMAQKEMRIFSSTCTSVPFHWGDDGKINFSQNGQPVYVR